jgi:hypothetical protein
MDDLELHALAVWGVLLAAAVTAVVLTCISAPYGRFSRGGWGPSIPSRLAWIIMESPAMAGFAWVYFQGQHALESAPLFMFGLWQLHYFHRTCIFPFRVHESSRSMPIVIIFIGFVFQSVNSWLNASWISHLGAYAPDWLSDPRFVIGVLLFVTGWVINIWADTILIHLRKPGEDGYRIPQGMLYRFVSSPNYMGEMLEWSAWALLTWSGAGFAFMVYTAANLIPRAITTHRWYQETFPCYPPSRRAVIPFVL